MLEWILNNLITIIVVLVIAVNLFLLRCFLKYKKRKHWLKVKKRIEKSHKKEEKYEFIEILSQVEMYKEDSCSMEEIDFAYSPSKPQRVEFSVFSPQKITKGSTFILDVWAYLPSFYNFILNGAKELGRDALLGRKIGVPIEKGEVITIAIDIQGLKIMDSVDRIVWEGEPTNAAFSVHVPLDASIGEFPGKAIIICQGIAIAKVLFVITVAATENLEYCSRSIEATYPKNAFASYASENREEVFSRLHGMKKVAPDLDVFVDVFSLRSGQNWKKKLEQHVPTKDVFYLFWSHYAAQSTWVEREWRLALKKRGLDYIDPVPLEDIDQAPPPPELQALHFTDAYVAYIQYLRLKNFGVQRKFPS